MDEQPDSGYVYSMVCCLTKDVVPTKVADTAVLSEHFIGFTVLAESTVDVLGCGIGTGEMREVGFIEVEAVTFARSNEHCKANSALAFCCLTSRSQIG
jgi:hypothetical protein